MVETSAKLTKRTVDSAVPKQGRYILWDTELKGFALRVAESGTKTYILRYRPRGTGRAGPRRFMVLGRHGVLTPDQARAHAKTILGAVAAGQDPAKERSRANSAMTIAQLVDLFISEHAKPKRKARTAADYAAVLHNHLVPSLEKGLRTNLLLRTSRSFICRYATGPIKPTAWSRWSRVCMPSPFGRA
jgi:Arm DNA-binding domain